MFEDESELMDVIENPQPIQIAHAANQLSKLSAAGEICMNRIETRSFAMKLFSLLLAAMLLLLTACQASFAQPANDQTGLAPSRWPLQATTAEGAQVTIFQPQLE